MIAETRVRRGPTARAAVRLLQAAIAVMFGIGIWYGNSGVATNAGIGLLVTFLPALLRRRFDVTMGVGLVLWITVAMFLHALGTLPLPGLEFLSPYKALDWWDHVTHALSSSLVAGAAYAVIRAFQVHSEHVELPPLFTFAYLLLFVMAFGVLWELLEFYIGVVSTLLGLTEVLTQYGLDDTVLDLVYNSVGGLLVALFGTAYLTGVSDQLAARLSGGASRP
ncbi:hypothetical protein [Halobaculum lipolyticum]|uniref:DUF2238 domain-containing protein n=1 Tax=Halobaculum lipolyticum TaxID=3032001 RepID=A0ABD5W8X4_9EURY|nr:hypothetical protein [Halobaculum sp. DT31]